MRVLALDTEDDSNGNVLLINFFDGETHYTFRGEKRLEAWNWLRGRGPCRVWACNMEYDIGNLFGDWSDEILTLTYNTSCFIKANWSAHGIMFNDTLRHWPMSVAKMGEFLGLAKMEAKGAGNRFDDVEYCRRDTEIVFRFVAEMEKRNAAIGAGLKNTLASTAFSLFRDRYCEINLERPSDAICDLLKGATYGGRVEIFKTGLLPGPIDCYDANSLYPSVMAANEYPDPTSGEMVKDLRPEREFIARLRVRIPRCEIPGTPYRHDGKLIFPTGEIEGTWAAPEVRQLLNDGGTVEKVVWVYEYGRTCRPFVKWVNSIYSRRLAETDELMKYTLKIFMNSVYGKFTESGKLEIIKKRKRNILENRPKHANIVLGAYTTAYGRLELLKKLRENSANICYCDTDSVFVQNTPKFESGQNLGEWKHVDRYRLCHFFLPKTYLAIPENGKPYHRAKGIPARAVKEFFNSFTATYDAPVRYRESKRCGIPQNKWIKKTRSLNAEYTKRIVLKNGKTEPIEIKG